MKGPGEEVRHHLSGRERAERNEYEERTAKAEVEPERNHHRDRTKRSTSEKSHRHETKAEVCVLPLYTNPYRLMCD